MSLPGCQVSRSITGVLLCVGGPALLLGVLLCVGDPTLALFLFFETVTEPELGWWLANLVILMSPSPPAGHAWQCPTLLVWVLGI